MAYHVPVLLEEVLLFLQPEQGQTAIDATLGGGGHAEAIAKRLGPTGTLIGVDRDREALDQAGMRLGRLAERDRPNIVLVHARYDRIAEQLRLLGTADPDTALFDIGVSSHQLDAVNRGFTFRAPDSELDMRMDQTSSDPTAANLLNMLPESELTRILRDHADEKWGARIAKFIVQRRQRAPLTRAGDLIEVVNAAIPAAARSRDIHPATRTFLALRIAVNSEFESLDGGIRQAVDLLKPGGRIAVISYHSGEDRIVKQLFALLSGKCVCPHSQPTCTCEARTPRLRPITKKPVTPTAGEIAENPRARSAKLRVAERI
jgi:16S rRNA (cytosine1402-N4)-methyltransferase